MMPAITAIGVESTWKFSGSRPRFERPEDDAVVGQDELPLNRADHVRDEERQQDQQHVNVLALAPEERDPYAAGRRCTARGMMIRARDHRADELVVEVVSNVDVDVEKFRPNLMPPRDPIQRTNPCRPWGSGRTRTARRPPAGQAVGDEPLPGTGLSLGAATASAVTLDSTRFEPLRPSCMPLPARSSGNRLEDAVRLQLLVLAEDAEHVRILEVRGSRIDERASATSS